MAEQTPRVDFYVLPGDSRPARWQFACRLAEKAYDEGLRVWIRTGDGQETAAVDEMLWTFKQGSFVPHATDRQYEGEPILIAENAAPDVKADMLLNLTSERFDRWQGFDRVAEVVDQSPEMLSSGRERFRLYRADGVEPQHHRLENR